MKITELQSSIIAFRDARERKQFHNPKDLAIAIGIEAGELQEQFLWKSQSESYEIGKNNPEVAEELADIVNYAFLFADACDIDLGKAILEKIQKNNEKYPVEKSKGNSTKYNKL